MYVVFSSYYKHGDTNIVIINSDHELRHYYLRSLRDLYESELVARGAVDFQQSLEVINQMFANHTLEQLFDVLLAKGEQEQAEWTIKAVLRGDNIQTIRGETETFTEYMGEHYVENYMGVGNTIAQTPNPLSYGYQGSFNRSQVPNIFSNRGY